MRVNIIRKVSDGLVSLRFTWLTECGGGRTAAARKMEGIGGETESQQGGWGAEDGGSVEGQGGKGGQACRGQAHARTAKMRAQVTARGTETGAVWSRENQTSKERADLNDSWSWKVISATSIMPLVAGITFGLNIRSGLHLLYLV